MGSKITFFKNGVSQGVAFENLFGGDYYPAVSLYRGGRVSANFGPIFKFVPREEIYSGWKPFCERFSDSTCEEALFDLVEAMDAEAEAPSS